MTDEQLLALSDEAFEAVLEEARLGLEAAVARSEVVCLRLREQKGKRELRDAVRDPVGLLLAIAHEDGDAIRDVLSVWNQRELLIPLAVMTVSFGKDLLGDEFVEALEEYALELADSAPS